MPETREHIELNVAAVEQGYKNCRITVKSFFRGFLWIASNLPGDQRRSLDALLHHVIRVSELLALDSETGLSLDVWHEVRDDLSDAFLDKCTTVELAALIDMAKISHSQRVPVQPGDGSRSLDSQSKISDL